MGEKSNNSDKGSAKCFDLVGVDALSIGCVEVRLNGVAERGVRGDGAGRDVEDLTGVMWVWFVGGLDEAGLLAGISGVDGRVGTLDCSSEQGCIYENSIQCQKALTGRIAWWMGGCAACPLGPATRTTYALW